MPSKEQICQSLDAPVTAQGTTSFALKFLQSLGRNTPNFRGKYRLLVGELCKVVRQWPHSVRTVTRDGFQLLRCDLRYYSYRVIFLYGVYEYDVDWACGRLLTPGDTVVDIGACFGYHSIANAIRVGPTGHIYSIEPQTDMFARLRENIDANELGNVDIDQIALSDVNEPLELHSFEQLDPGHASISTLGRSDYSVARCLAVPFDDFVKSKRIRDIALIKLDVEGSEMKILRGAKQLLSSSRPPIWIVEVNFETAHACGFHPSDLLRLLGTYGYSAYRPVWGKIVRNIERLEFCNASEVRHGENIVCAINQIHGDRLAQAGVQA